MSLLNFTLDKKTQEIIDNFRSYSSSDQSISIGDSSSYLNYVDIPLRGTSVNREEKIPQSVGLS